MPCFALATEAVGAEARAAGADETVVVGSVAVVGGTVVVTSGTEVVVGDGTVVAGSASGVEGVAAGLVAEDIVNTAIPGPKSVAIMKDPAAVQLPTVVHDTDFNSERECSG